MEISLVIPAYNEEKRIGTTIVAVSEFMREHFSNYEIIVVDDGSTDRTVDIINKYSEKDENIKLLLLNCNKGKGQAVKTGVANAKGKCIFFTDADLPYSLDTILKGMKILSDTGAQLIIGSRDLYKDRPDVPYPIHRTLMSKMFSVFLNTVLRLGITDTQCGIKGFEAKTAKYIFQHTTIDGFGFDVELLYIARKHKFNICRIPVNLSHDKDTKINIITDSIKMIRDVFKVKLNDWCGRYN